MLTIDDCIGMSGLTEDEIAAVAEHEHLPAMLALELGNFLCRSPAGQAQLERMIIDDIGTANQRGNLAHAAKLASVLDQFRQRFADRGKGNIPAHH
jgi:hypothetical protein